MSTDPEQPSPYGPGEMNETRMQHQNELSEILRDFKDDPTLNGILMTTKAGVLLSLTADREVVDAVGLKPQHIKALLDRLPFIPENETIYRGVDGTKVPRDQWFHPDKSELPPPYVPPPERREENMTPEMWEKNRKFLEERKNAKCELRLLSDHDLGMKESKKEKEEGETET